MRLKERFTKTNILLLVIFSLVPLAVICTCTALLIINIYLSPLVLIITMLTHMAVLGVIESICLSKLTARWKILHNCGITIGLLVCTAIFIFFAMTIGQVFWAYHYKADEAVAPWGEVTEIKEFDALPTVDEIGNAQEVDYYEYFFKVCIFAWDSYTLICTYGIDEYQAQEDYINQTYVFQTDELQDLTRDPPISPYAEIDGFSFRVLSISEYQLRYPKKMILIGTNDQTNQIAYIAYDSSDLDYIEESLADFIEEECGWKYIFHRRLFFN